VRSHSRHRSSTRRHRSSIRNRAPRAAAISITGADREAQPKSKTRGLGPRVLP
jgi:hypothetical protein